MLGAGKTRVEKAQDSRKNYEGALLTINDGVTGLVWIRLLSETNGLIRQYFLKSTDFANITPERVRWVQDKLWRTPKEKIGILVTQREI